MDQEQAVLRAIAALEEQYKNQLETGPNWLGISVNVGWLPLVRALFARVDRELTPFERRRVRWAQIKQKWGGLRAYYHLAGERRQVHVDIMTPTEHVHLVEGDATPLSTKLDRMIADATAEASRTCEICGEPGTRVNHGGYVFVACAKHAIGSHDEPDCEQS